MFKTGYVMSILSVSVFLALGFYREAVADTVIFKNGKRLECKVIPPEDDSKRIRLVLEDEGRSSLVVAVDSIEKIDYDYESLLNALDDNAFVEHYKLGVWCLKRKLYKEAIERFLHCLGEAGVPVDIEYMLGQAYEALDAPRYLSARDHYRNFLTSSKDVTFKKECEEALTRVEKIIKEKGLDGKGVEELSSITDGLEAAGWASPGWGYDAQISSPEVQGAKTANKTLEVNYLNRDARGKVLAVNDRKTPVQLRLDKDLENTPVLTLDVYNPEKEEISFSVAFTTGEGYEWFEAPMIKVPADKWLTGLSLNMLKKNWKSKQSNWQHNSAVGNLGKVRALVFVIYNGNKKGKIYFDSIEFKTD